MFVKIVDADNDYYGNHNDYVVDEGITRKEFYQGGEDNAPSDETWQERQYRREREYGEWSDFEDREREEGTYFQNILPTAGDEDRYFERGREDEELEEGKPI